MLLTVSDVLDPAQLEALEVKFDRLTWRDGRVTAGAVAKQVKRNEQADLSTAAGRAVQSELMSAISAHPVIVAASRPRCFSHLLLSRTGVDGRYGPHIDNALMKKGDQRLRTDLSFTLFLSPPDSYDGGELIIHAAGVTQSVKGEAGDLVLYPASSVHEVAPVIRGARVVCVGWIESLVPDSAHRELLFDLENLRVSLRSALPAQSAELMTLNKTIANLLRLWAKP